MNKHHIVKKIIEHLKKELDLYIKASRAAHAEATHEQSKAENKYDTRGLEAAYLARGQSKQAAEIEQTIEQFETLVVRAFGPDDSIDLGALVELKNKTERAIYFVGPRAGGTEVAHDGKEVMVITPQSPLGQQLFGKKNGDSLKLVTAGSHDNYRIVSVT